MRKKSNQQLTLRGLVAATVVSGMVLFSSCNGDEAQQGPTGDPMREVTFLAYAQKGSRTRVQETTTSTIETFNAFAIWSVDGEPLPNLTLKDVTNGPNWTYTPAQLWPENGLIDFYTFSPATAATNGVTTHYDATNYAPSDINIDYTVPDLADQEDLLAAVKMGVSCSAPAPVSLNFQHVLSRIQIKARPAAGSPACLVHRVRFVHLSNEGNLVLSPANIPDGDGFTYNDVLDREPLILWTGHNAATTNYEFDFDPAIAVDDHAEYDDILSGAQAFMVLPQKTKLGSSIAIANYEDDLHPADPADDGFYIRIDFATTTEPDAKLVKYYAVREPLDPARNLPLSFEAGRRYTFVVDLSGSDYIEFADVNISEFDEAFADQKQPVVDITPDPDPVLEAVAEAYMPASHGGFAGSNIYWDKEKQRLTFDSIGVTEHENYQGLYFKYGSLVGISPVGAWADTTVLYTPHGINGAYAKTTAAEYSAAGLYSDITVGAGTTDLTTINGVTDMRKSGYATYLNTLPAELAAFRGDVCAYLSGRPGIPQGFWRLPTSAEFDPKFPAPFVSPGDYARVPAESGNFTWNGQPNTKNDGTYAITNGWRLEYANGKFTFFPAAGNRTNINGVLYYLGTNGNYWGASPIGTNGSNVNFSGTSVTPAYHLNRHNGFSVRCVKK